MCILYISNKLFSCNFLEARVVSSQRYEVDERGRYEYVILYPSVAKRPTVSSLINGATAVSNPKPARTLESTIREIIGGEEANKKCRKGICGKPDFIKNGLPGEIKTFNGNIKYNVLEKGICQAALYAWIFHRDVAYLVIGIYQPVNEGEAEIKEIIELSLRLERVNERKIEAIAQ